MGNGFWNKILHVDLTKGTWEVEQPGDDFYRHYGGGRGYIAHYLLKYVPKGADPLGPDNVLVMAPGVVTGAPVPGAGRHSVGAKSPLTGGFGEAEAGGFWGAELKRAGWDAVVVHGASEKPVYLWINQDEVEIRDASHLWGKLTGEAEETIREELDDQFIRVAQIGPAGENMVRYACVGNDLNEVAGRTGLGAVMGSKKLKGIAVRGKTPVELHDKDALKGIAKWVSTTLDENHRGFHEFGTGAAMIGKGLEGGLPTLNYRMGNMESVGNVDAVTIRDSGARVAMESCYACSVRCKKVVQVEQRKEDAGTTKKGQQIIWDEKGRYDVDPMYGGPEYESLASLGPTLGIDDMVAVLKGNEMCNALTLDTISTGATIAWAMECYEKGILTDEDTGGIPLRFSDEATVIKLIDMIARREGIGDLLAEGSARAAEKIGKGSEQFLTTVKGLELAMHDPRHMERMRVSYLLAPTGGDHMAQTGDKNGLRNQVGLCHFLQYDDEQSRTIINGITGWELSPEDMIQLAHRGLTLARLFNNREGFDRSDDTLPRRFSEDLPMHKGLTQTQIDEIVEAYYVEQGWDGQGAPTEATIEALGLQEDAAVAV